MLIIMKFVEPIRSIQKLNEIKDNLRSKWKIKELLLIEHGINSALRISDLLELKVWDVFNDDGSIKEYYILNESKTGKVSKIYITRKVNSTLCEYKRKYPVMVSKPTNYVFFRSKDNDKGNKPISRQQARKVINKACSSVWLDWSYGWHTLRKTRWYQARKKWISLPVIQEKLNHSSLSVTKRYLGITDDEIKEASLKLDL